MLIHQAKKKSLESKNGLFFKLCNTAHFVEIYFTALCKRWFFSNSSCSLGRQTHSNSVWVYLSRWGAEGISKWNSFCWFIPHGYHSNRLQTSSAYLLTKAPSFPPAKFCHCYSGPWTPLADGPCHEPTLLYEMGQFSKPLIPPRWSFWPQHIWAALRTDVKEELGLGTADISRFKSDEML